MRSIGSLTKVEEIFGRGGVLNRADLSSRSHVICLVIQLFYDMLDLLTFVFIIRQ
jgi:hypothetical protein